MTTNPRDDKGLSPRHLLLIFLAGVAVCGVFFSLGFLVGYNERSVRMSPTTERVDTPATIPPTVNSPLETVPVGPNSGSTSATSIPPVASQPASPPPLPAGEQKPGTSPGPSSPAAAPPPSLAKAEREPDPGTAVTPPTAPRAVGAGFTVQVTAVRTRQDAETVLRVLKGRGYPVFLVAPQHAGSNDSLYRVQVGPFGSRDRAEKALAKLKHQGFKPFIRH